VKRKRFAVEQIVAALKQVELGMPIADMTRRLGRRDLAYRLYSEESLQLRSKRPRRGNMAVDGSLRDECLNVHWFETLEDARAKIEEWGIDYNDSRPHQGLKEMTPTEYALKYRSIELEIVPQQLDWRIRPRNERR
jgi:transposase InsO family protein